MRHLALTQAAMRIKKQVENLTEPEVQQFNAYLNQKLGRIESFMSEHFPDEDTVLLLAKIERFEKHTAFCFEVKLTVPGFHPFVLKEVKHSVTEPMDLVFDRLDQMIHKEFDKRNVRA